jgi:hypothetical protein
VTIDGNNKSTIVEKIVGAKISPTKVASVDSPPDPIDEQSPEGDEQPAEEPKKTQVSEESCFYSQDFLQTPFCSPRSFWRSLRRFFLS